jgi:hypothetical protein
LNKVGRYGEAVVAVMDDTDLIGLGTPEWFGRVRKEAEAQLFGVGKKKNGRSTVEDEDELDEM